MWGYQWEPTRRDNLFLPSVSAGIMHLFVHKLMPRFLFYKFAAARRRRRRHPDLLPTLEQRECGTWVFCGANRRVQTQRGATAAVVTWALLLRLASRTNAFKNVFSLSVRRGRVNSSSSTTVCCAETFADRVSGKGAHVPRHGRAVMQIGGKGGGCMR